MVGDIHAINILEYIANFAHARAMVLPHVGDSAKEALTCRNRGQELVSLARKPCKYACFLSCRILTTLSFARERFSHSNSIFGRQ